MSDFILLTDREDIRLPAFVLRAFTRPTTKSPYASRPSCSAPMPGHNLKKRETACSSLRSAAASKFSRKVCSRISRSSSSC